MTAVCSTRNGAGAVRWARTTSSTTRARTSAAQERFDLILDLAGSQGFFDMAEVMKLGQRIIVVIGAPKKGPMLGPIKRIAVSKLVAPSSSRGGLRCGQ